MTRNYVSGMLKELKRQRSQIEKAIAALEAIDRKQPNGICGRERAGLKETVIERKNGTTDHVIPFVRQSQN